MSIPSADRSPAASPPPGAAAGTGTLLLITLTWFAFSVASTMIGPLLVDLARDLDVSLGQAGLLGAAMAAPWALGGPFTGLLSDRVGRRPLILVGLLGAGLCTLGAALAPSFAVLLLLRFLSGAFGACATACLMAAVGDLFPVERRGMAMSWLSMGLALSAVLGVPLVGLIDGLYGWRPAFAAIGLLLLAILVPMYLGFPGTRPAGAPAGLLATYRGVLGVRGLANVLTANLLERTVYHTAVLYVPSFLMLSYGLGASDVAPALALIAIGTIAGNVLGGWLGDRLPKAAVFVVAQLATAAVALALFGLTAGVLLSTLVGALFGLASTASRPAFLALGTELSTRHRGAVLGLVTLTNQGGGVLGSTLGALVIGLADYATLALVVAAVGALAATAALPLTRTQRAR